MRAGEPIVERLPGKLRGQSENSGRNRRGFANSNCGWMKRVHSQPDHQAPFQDKGPHRVEAAVDRIQNEQGRDSWRESERWGVVVNTARKSQQGPVTPRLFTEKRKGSSRAKKLEKLFELISPKTQKSSSQVKMSNRKGSQYNFIQSYSQKKKTKE